MNEPVTFGSLDADFATAGVALSLVSVFVVFASGLELLDVVCNSASDI